MNKEELLKYLPLIFLIIGLFLTSRSYKLKKNGIKTTGEVVDIHTEQKDNETSYYPIIRFQTEDGKVYTQKSSSGGSTSYFPGQEIDIIYNPQNPREFDINNLRTLWLLPLIFILIGTVGLYYTLTT